jgi:hypothetical protein
LAGRVRPRPTDPTQYDRPATFRCVDSPRADRATRNGQHTASGHGGPIEPKPQISAGWRHDVRRW